MCVPVHNEAATIGSVLDALRGQESVTYAQVIVCANGCTDSTCAVIESRMRKWSVVTLLERPWRGKARAWNELFDRAYHDIVVFVDGDVTLPPGTLSALEQALINDPHLVAVSAQPVAQKAKRTGVDRLVKLPVDRPIPTGLCGGCYAVRATTLRCRLAECGYACMPEDIIAEDRWLTEVIGQGRWRVVPEAPVFFAFPALRDLPAHMKRHMRAHLQLRDRLPGRYLSGTGIHPPTGAALLREWKARDGHGGFLRRLFTAVIIRCIQLYSRILVLSIPRSTRYRHWDRTPSTKRTVVLPEMA